MPGWGDVAATAAGLTALRYLVAVAEERTFTRAPERLRPAIPTENEVYV